MKVYGSQVMFVLRIGELWQGADNTGRDLGADLSWSYGGRNMDVWLVYTWISFTGQTLISINERRFKYVLYDLSFHDHLCNITTTILTNIFLWL